MNTAIGTAAFDETAPLPLVIHLPSFMDLSDDQLFEFAVVNRDLRFERNQLGELIIMPPSGGDSGEQNSELNMQLRYWAKKDGTGTTFDSSTGFILPNRAMRSPDAAWVSRARLAGLTPEQRKKYLPLCPDFVVEIRSESDHLSDLRLKMREYISNGGRLGLLIDPLSKKVELYRHDGEIESLDDPAMVSCDPVLPGFVLNVNELW